MAVEVFDGGARFIRAGHEDEAASSREMVESGEDHRMLDVTVSAEESLKVVGGSVEWEIQDVEIAQSTIAIRPHWYAAIEDQDRDGGSYEAMEALTRCRKGAREATNGNKAWTCRLGTGEGEGASEGTGRPKLRLPPCIPKKKASSPRIHATQHSSGQHGRASGTSHYRSSLTHLRDSHCATEPPTLQAAAAGSVAVWSCALSLVGCGERALA
jgi:hypothetical protein